MVYYIIHANSHSNLQWETRKRICSWNVKKAKLYNQKTNHAFGYIRKLSKLKSDYTRNYSFIMVLFCYIQTQLSVCVCSKYCSKFQNHLKCLLLLFLTFPFTLFLVHRGPSFPSSLPISIPSTLRASRSPLGSIMPFYFLLTFLNSTAHCFLYILYSKRILE